MDSSPKKLLFISMTDVANGAENVLLMAAMATKSQILFLKRVKAGRLKVPEGFPAAYIGNSLPAGFLGLIKALWPYRKHYVIMSTHPYLNGYLGILKRMGYLQSHLIVRECTSVFARYSSIKRLTYRFIYQLGYPVVNLVVCQTAEMKGQLLNAVGFLKSKKVIVQQNPVNLVQVLAKAELSVNDPDLNTAYICSAGRLIYEKGFDVLIRAFSEILTTHPNIKLLILGDGPEREKLTRLIADKRLNGKVILKGRIENPMPYFKHAKACVVSSIREGFPNVLLEMMALNPLVISTLCAGGVENIGGITTVPVNQPEELAKAICAALYNAGSNNNNLQISAPQLQSRTPQVFVNNVLAALG